MHTKCRRRALLQELEGKRALLVEARTAQLLKECTFSPQTNEGQKKRLLQQLLAGSESGRRESSTEGSQDSADEMPDRQH